MTPSRHHLLIGAAVALAGMLAFAGTLGNQLVWDDPLILAHHREMLERQGVGGLLATQYQAPGIPSGYHRPLVSLSFGAQLLAGAGSPVALHLVNLLLYGAGAFFVTLLLLRLLSPAGAAAGGALFALHPVHAESLGMVSNRHDLLLGVFVPLAVLAWLEGRRGRGACAWGGAGLFLLALLTKETAYLLPAVLLLWDLLLPGEGRGWARRNLPWLGAWGAALAVALLLRTGAGVGFGPGASLEELSLGGRLALLPGVLLTYLRLLVFPLGLTAFYTADLLRITVPSLVGAGAALAVFLLPPAQGRPRAGLPGLAWFLLLLLPVLGLARQTGAPLAERHLFLPLLGFALAFGALTERLMEAARAKGARLLLHASLASLLLLLGSLSWARARVWRDEVTLFSHLTRAAPRYFLGHYNLANALRLAGRAADAEAGYREALRLNPRHHDSAANLAAHLAEQGRFSGAVPWYRTAAALAPRNPADRLGLGYSLLQTGDAAGAAAELEQALALGPARSADILAFLGDAYAALGRRDDARRAWSRALAEDPLLSGVREKLAP